MVCAGACRSMEKSDNFPESFPDLMDSDDVEILEVVGVEDDGTPVASGPGEPDGDDGEDYLLDLDGMEADPASGPGPVEVETVTESGRAARSARAGAEEDQERQRLVRLRADYDNLRKRIDRERREFELHANLALVGRLLPVVDNLERALAAASNDGGEGPLREGLVMIHRQLTDQLHGEGLRAIDAVGQTFDPNLHDATATQTSDEFPANTVMEELRKGYLFQDRVLRPSMVKVSLGVTNEREDD